MGSTLSSPTIRLALTIVIQAMLFAGILTASGTAATTAGSGTLIATGALKANWKIFTCASTYTASTGEVELSFGTAGTLMDIQYVGKEGPHTGINAATTKAFWITFAVAPAPGRLWEAGWGAKVPLSKLLTHHGTGTLTTSTDFTSGTLNSEMVGVTGNTHVDLTWKNCRFS
jgi:hypothetical protein